MKVSELTALEPRAQAYELRKDGRYLICLDQRLPAELLEGLSKSLREAMEHKGIKLVGVIDFIPRIFELEKD